MNTKIRTLAECGILVAMATVLGQMKLLDLPYGGSVTLASMLPVALFAYRHGVLRGLVAGLLYGGIQLLLGLNTLSYFTTWQSVVAIILLDYLLAFGVLGLSGIFRREKAHGGIDLLVGLAFACVLRYLLHVIAGATLWVGLSIPDSLALGYSLGYNATYMIPETLILLLTAGYLTAALDFRRDIPRPIRRAAVDRRAELCRLGAGALAVLALGYAVVAVFSKLQDAESGDFIISGLGSVDWVAVGVVVLGCLAADVLLLLLARHFAKEAQTKAVDK